MTEEFDAYFIGRHASESERLNEQHKIVTETLGFHIHPNITLPSSSSTSQSPLKICDIATGTGIWLFDISMQLHPSTTQLTGYDISSSQFPPKETWPPNIQLKTQSMLEPFPSSELGTYDLISIRFVSVAIKNSEWRHAVKNVLSLLKPGGWIQWIDADAVRWFQEKAGISRRAIWEIQDTLNEFATKVDLKVGMIKETASMLREEGCVDIWEDYFSLDRIQGDGRRERRSRNLIGMFGRAIANVAKVPGSGWSEERAESVFAEARKEVQDGVYGVLDYLCVIGRKG